MSFSVVTLNIFHDRAEWPERRGVIVRALRALRPDAVLLQEVLQTAALPNQAGTLAEALGYGCHFASADPEDGAKRFGNAILTPHPVLRRDARVLEPRSDARVALHARLDLGIGEVDVYTTHLHYGPEAEIRAEQVRDLLRFVDVTRGPGAAVLGGDFNAPPGAAELEALAERFVDVHPALHPEASGTSTYNPQLAKESPAQVDHLWAAGPLRPIAAEIIFREAEGGVWASDHFGVRAEFELET